MRNITFWIYSKTIESSEKPLDISLPFIKINVEIEEQANVEFKILLNSFEILYCYMEMEEESSKKEKSHRIFYDFHQAPLLLNSFLNQPFDHILKNMNAEDLSYLLNKHSGKLEDVKKIQYIFLLQVSIFITIVSLMGDKAIWDLNLFPFYFEFPFVLLQPPPQPPQPLPLPQPLPPTLPGQPPTLPGQPPQPHLSKNMLKYMEPILQSFQRMNIGSCLRICIQILHEFGLIWDPFFIEGTSYDLSVSIYYCYLGMINYFKIISDNLEGSMKQYNENLQVILDEKEKKLEEEREKEKKEKEEEKEEEKEDEKEKKEEEKKGKRGGKKGSGKKDKKLDQKLEALESKLLALESKKTQYIHISSKDEKIASQQQVDQLELRVKSLEQVVKNLLRF